MLPNCDLKTSLSGLALYKLMDHLTRMNRRKNMARSGLKQIGEHMHVVTRTMSAEPATGKDKFMYTYISYDLCAL